MYVDLPKVTRCCFCLPLRYGLIVWSYLKLIWCLFLTVVMTYKIVISSVLGVFRIDFIVTMIIALCLLVDLIITLIFIIGAHKKNPRLLRVYYRYGVTTLVVLFLLYVLGIGMSIFLYFFHNMRYIYIISLYEYLLFGAGVLLLNLYVLALIRSEVTKLENNVQFTFHNLAAEPSCYMGESECTDENNQIYKL